MKHEFIEERKYGEEKRIRNGKRHRAQRRDEIRTARAVKRGEYQKAMKEIDDDTSSQE